MCRESWLLLGLYAALIRNSGDQTGTGISNKSSTAQACTSTGTVLNNSEMASSISIHTGNHISRSVIRGHVPEYLSLPHDTGVLQEQKHYYHMQQ